MLTMAKGDRNLNVHGQVNGKRKCDNYNGILCSLKKKEVLMHAAAQMTLKDIVLNKVSQPQMHKCPMTSLM
jgi:hypothetical protein